jgi:hypothetical protein
MAMGAHMQEVIQRAHLIDRDLLAGFFLPAASPAAASLLSRFGERAWLQQAEVRVVALRQPAASQALAAGLPDSVRASQSSDSAKRAPDRTCRSRAGRNQQRMRQLSASPAVAARLVCAFQLCS